MAWSVVVEIAYPARTVLVELMLAKRALDQTLQLSTFHEGLDFQGPVWLDTFAPHKRHLPSSSVANYWSSGSTGNIQNSQMSWAFSSNWTHAQTPDSHLLTGSKKALSGSELRTHETHQNRRMGPLRTESGFMAIRMQFLAMFL